MTGAEARTPGHTGKAPAKKGKYKIRVRVTYSGTSNPSAVKTVTVK